MASLTPASAAAIARLRAYVPPPTQYLNVPLSRRAAVLILLFADQKGDLKVVLTMRAKTMSSYAGHAALPGGKADFPIETPFQTARREASEEIGLPLSDTHLPFPYRVEHLCQLPANLAKTELAVRPCVAYLAPTRTNSFSTSNSSTQSRPTPNPLKGKSIEETLIPRLSAAEVSAVFTAPFASFLHKTASHTSESATSPNAAQPRGPGVEASGWPAEWYKGTWTDWHESRWRMHNFFVPVNPKIVALPKPNTRETGGKAETNGASAAAEEKEKQHDEEAKQRAALPARFKVFGMTARILVDCARVAYAQEPEFEHNSHFGDEDMIARLIKVGRMGQERKKGDELTREVLRSAAMAKM